MKKININMSQEIAPFYHKHFLNKKILHQGYHGGRGKTASTRNAMGIAFSMIGDPTCEVVVVRQHHSGHRESTFNELKKAFRRYGANIKATVSPIKITYRGSNIYFCGMNDYESVKGMTSDDPDKQVKIIYFSEITQMKSDYEMRQVIATFSRGNPNYLIILYEWNDPPNLTHWVYDWREKMDASPDTYFQHNTYLNLPEELQKRWLGKFFIKEAELLKKVDFEQYKNIYLGLPAKLKGACYKSFDIDQQVEDFDIISTDYYKINIGVDYGETDATSFIAEGFKKHYNGIDYFNQYWHKNGVSNEEKTITDYVDDFFDFCNRCHQLLGVKRTLYIYIDSAEKTFRKLIEQRIIRDRVAGISIEKLNKLEAKLSEQSSIQERVNTTNMMLATGFLRIHKSRCKQVIIALDSTEYKNHMRQDDGTFDIDSLDAGEYGWLMDIKEIRERLPFFQKQAIEVN